MKRAFADHHCEVVTPATALATASSNASGGASTGDTTASGGALGAAMASLDSSSPTSTQVSSCGEDGSQKRKADSDLTSRDTPAGSKRRITDRIVKGLQEGTKSLVETVEKMEEKKMDRLDQIITKCIGYGALAGHDGGDAVNISSRLDKVERTIEELKGTTDKILHILQNRL